MVHDEEWGVPVHDDRRLFEMLLLEGAQAVRKEVGSFDAYIWQFVDGRPRVNSPATLKG